MKDAKIVDQVLNQSMEVVNKLRTHGEDVTDQKVVEKIHKGFPP